MTTGTEAQPQLEGADPGNRKGGQEVQPPSVVTELLSDNKHSAPWETPSPTGAICESNACADLAGYTVFWPGRTIRMCTTHMLQARDIAAAMGFEVDARILLPYEAPTLRSLGRLPSVELHIRASHLRPGQLSLGVHADSDTWNGVFELLNAAGFKAGDVVRLTVVRR